MAFKVGGIEVAQRSLQSPDDRNAPWDGLNPGITTLSKGHEKTPGRRAFDVDTIYERDIGIPLRDGHIVRGDVFRPANNGQERVPALVAWSPYGKTGTGEQVHHSLRL